jgi:hypothetical protein
MNRWIGNFYDRIHGGWVSVEYYQDTAAFAINAIRSC